MAEQYPVDGLLDVTVARLRGIGWAAYSEGQRLPMGRKRYRVRRADGAITHRSLHSLVWHAGPGPERAWDYQGQPIPGFGNYRLDGEPGSWTVRSYAHRSRNMPGTGLAVLGHPVDNRPIVNLVTDWGEKVMWQLSRVVLVAHVGWPEPGFDTCRHLNGDPFDDRPENLAWGSVADNAQDRHAHGRTRGITPGGRKAEPAGEVAA